MNAPVGTIYDSTAKLVIVHNGTRGSKGYTGDDGDQGLPGDSFNMIGPWVSGTTYSPLDAVTSRSSAADGVTSLFIQKSSQASSVSLVEPHLDPARWDEVGATDTESSFGGVWKVIQPSHPFSKVGQPAALRATGYELAQSTSADTVGIALVRGIIDSNTFLLQSTGGLSNIDPTVFIGSTPVLGTLYYVSSSAGLLTSTPPVASNLFVNPILKTGNDTTKGAVLPWVPVSNEVTLVGTPTARTKYYFTATAGQTVFTGLDDEGSTLDLSSGLVEAFQNGLNLRDTDQFTFDATTLTLTAAATLDDKLEIWSDELVARQPIAGSKIDPLIFDGVTTVFSLDVGAVNISTLILSPTLGVFLDGNPQEPDVDFVVFDDGGTISISFTIAPEAETGFWAIIPTSEV